MDYTWTTTLPERPYLGHWESTYKYTQVSKKKLQFRALPPLPPQKKIFSMFQTFRGSEALVVAVAPAGREEVLAAGVLPEVVAVAVPVKMQAQPSK